MSETVKTLIFVAAGVVALFAGFAVVPQSDSFNVESLVGQRLNQFSVADPKRLKIVRFDSETATAREFEVAEENGLWTIPSKQGYPADAARQMAEAATCLMDREILRIAATSASQHEELGVIDPSSAKLDTQSEGVGIRVVMSDNSRSVLTDMIVGKPVKDSDGQYYVRNTNQDVVYVVNLDPDKLSTRFEDWIEEDLLKLNPFDIRRVEIKDYSAEMMLSLSGIQMNWDRRAEMVLSYDNSESKWNADSLKKFDTTTKQYVDFTLAEDEKLNADALQELRSGLDDLQIVDVERKPSGLSADLKAGDDFLRDNAAATSLMTRGFAPVAIGPEKQSEILSTEGEVICSLDNGVEYVLRFGNLQMEGSESPATDESAEDDADASTDAGIHRYLFVMARFNPDLIPEPDQEQYPELPEGITEEALGQYAADQDKADEQDSDKQADEEKATAEADSENADAEKSAEDEAEGTADSGPQGDSAEEDATPDRSEEIARIVAERKRIDETNVRNSDERNEKIEEGKERIAELNERFGDWYYVISNEVYQQVHLGLDRLIEKKESDEEGDPETTGDDAGVSGLPDLQFGSENQGPPSP